MISSLRRGAGVSQKSLLENVRCLESREMARSWPGKERWKKAVSKREQTLPEAGKQAGVQHDSDFRRELLKNVSSSSF